MSKGKEKKVTPLMKQFNSIKAKHPDAILLFRVGDFYETFGEDAIKAAEILGIVLTHRNNGGDQTELAGFPHHSLNTYLPKLVRAGYRVAVCDQLEDPKQTKTIVKRGVTELVTPGVALNDDILTAKSNNFLASIFISRTSIGVAFLDISTGEFLVTQGEATKIDRLLQNFTPKEVLLQRGQKNLFHDHFGTEFHTFQLEDWVFQPDYAHEQLTQHFKTKGLEGYGIAHLNQGVVAAGSIFHYLKETQHQQLAHITQIKHIVGEDYVWMDKFTIRNLELFQSPQQGTPLLEIIDHTTTAMGGRLLKRWLALPLKNKKNIEDRHQFVAHFVNHPQELQQVVSWLKPIGDLERLVSKIATAKISPRELVSLKNAIQATLPLEQYLKNKNLAVFNHYLKSYQNWNHIGEKISSLLADEAPVHIGKGNTIKAGYSTDLDDLRLLAYSGKDYLDQMLRRETERTGITSLKIASNNVFGYYIEVRNTHKDKVPDDWTRKQTLVNAERYITEELKEYEYKILGAEERIYELEQKIFSQLLVWLQSELSPIQINAKIIAAMDVLVGFASLAIKNNYTQPQITEDTCLDIKDGRHAVIEQMLPPGEIYISNDLILNNEQQIIMITGPNMSGKSAILRQTALIVLMAQIGSFVPATSAKIGVVDKIFTRVGASDNLSLGQSTFMVEMNETASILNNLTASSLIILDEIGRGTSTYDGISIAWAIANFLHEHPNKPKTLFATHYHELNEMTHSFERIKNYNVSVKELKDQVLFLRKLTPGGSEHSFGIHVAKMAGMPQQVIQTANKLLKKLENSAVAENRKHQINESQKELQLSFFQLDDPLLEELKDEILHLDIDTLTPVEALMKLNEIKRMLSRKNRATS